MADEVTISSECGGKGEQIRSATTSAKESSLTALYQYQGAHCLGLKSANRNELIVMSDL